MIQSPFIKRDIGCVQNAILSYYSYYFSSIQYLFCAYYANFLHAWNTRMTYYICQNLLNITRVHWNQYRSCVRNGILPYDSYYIEVCCVYTVNNMWIFCMHGMPGLTATFAEFWCMHLKTLHGILFPRTQRAPCDVSSSNAWVNWRRGIVIINVTLLYVRTVYIHVKYKLSLCI